MEVTRQYNSEMIFDLLEQEIINLTIKPGQELGENELSTRFGVSRTPVRAAMRRLADRGLVEITPYKGTRATLLNMDEIEQMIYMRVAVEASVLADFCQEVPPLTMEKMRYIIRKQTVLINGEFEHSRFYELDEQLHGLWFEVTGKLHIWELIRQAQVHYTRFRMLDILAAQQYPQIISEHEQLFDAVMRGDVAMLRSVIQEHLYGGVARLRPRLESEFADFFR